MNVALRGGSADGTVCDVGPPTVERLHVPRLLGEGEEPVMTGGYWLKVSRRRKVWVPPEPCWLVQETYRRTGETDEFGLPVFEVEGK